MGRICHVLGARACGSLGDDHFFVEDARGKRFNRVAPPGTVAVAKHLSDRRLSLFVVKQQKICPGAQPALEAVLFVYLGRSFCASLPNYSVWFLRCNGFNPRAFLGARLLKGFEGRGGQARGSQGSDKRTCGTDSWRPIRGEGGTLSHLRKGE